MMDGKKFSLIKPTPDTPFHIDFEWWKEHDNNWQVYLQSCLCLQHQQIYQDYESCARVDWIDPITAEIHPVDGLQHVLMTHCAKQPDFIMENTAMVDAVFRLLLANANQPLTPGELGNILKRPADTILRTLTGTRIYRGIRPFQNG